MPIGVCRSVGLKVLCLCIYNKPIVKLNLDLLFYVRISKNRLIVGHGYKEFPRVKEIVCVSNVLNTYLRYTPSDYHKLG